MPLAELGDLTLHFNTHGDGDPVLGIMGFGLDQRFWAGQIPAITATHRFITFDNRGTGHSIGSTVDTIDGLAADAVRLLDHLAIESAVVFGVSMGGAVAQRLALDHPDRVSALILAITWARPIEFMRRQYQLARVLLEAGGAETVVEASLLRMFSPEFFEIGQEAVDQMLSALTAGGAPEIAATETLLAQLDAIESHDVLDRLHKITCPTLVVGGVMDMMVPYFAAREIAEAIPGAELATFETGHGLLVEEMQDFNDRIAKFLASLDGRS